MSVWKTILIFILCLWNVCSSQIDEYSDENIDEGEYTNGGRIGDLVQVLVVTRHGQRTPKNPYPADPYRAKTYWPEGWLQLTSEGAKQHRELGHWLRKSYPDIIPKTFRSENSLIRSTGISRTLASAFALTSALFPDQAIPIHSSPSEYDKLFSPHKSCPAFKDALETFMDSDEVRKNEKERKPLYKWLSSKMGKNVKGLDSIESLYSILTIEKQRGLRLPEWTNEVYPQPLKNLTALYLSRSSATRQLARLRYGMLVKDILHNARKAGNKDGAKKFLLYSAHDFTVIGLLNSLGVFDGFPSGFAASITFEIRRGDEETGNSLDLFYRNDSLAAPKQLLLKRCGNPCYLNNLEKVLEDIIPIDINSECNNYEARFLLSSSYSPDEVSMLWGTALGAAALGALLVVFCSKVFLWAKDKCCGPKGDKSSPSIQDPVITCRPEIWNHFNHKPSRRQYMEI